MTDIPRASGIYLLTHIATGATYVGQALDLLRRYRGHARNFRIGVRQNRHFGPLTRQGCTIADFKFKVLQLCDAERLDRCETRWIRKLKPTLNNNSPRR